MKIICTLLTLLISMSVFAQSQEVMDKIESAKIALITQRLELSPEQAEKFWPVYREYSEKQREIHSDFQNLRRSYRPETATEDESRKMVEKGHQIKERMVQLDKQYSDRMLNVINNRQLLRLREAENDFRKELMQRLKQQRQRQQQNGFGDRPSNDEIRQQRQQQRGN